MGDPQTVSVTGDLLAICREIVAEGKTAEQWAEVESDDMFRRGPFEGGYDATEEAFTFSRRAADGGELWLQLTLDEVGRVARGHVTRLLARPAR